MRWVGCRQFVRSFAAARLLAFGALLVSGCQTAPPAAPPVGALLPPQAMRAPTPGALPPEAWTGHPGDGVTRPGLPPHGEGAAPSPAPVVAAPGVPYPEHAFQPQPWAPPGIARPWPPDEYICDGGDTEYGATVAPDWRVRGLDITDTVGHYDTLSGRRSVEASNRVCVYAPRFAAVRKVTGIVQHARQERMAEASLPLRLQGQESLGIATTAIQPVQPVGELGLKQVSTFRDPIRGVGVDNVLRLVEFKDPLRSYENFKIVRSGQLDDAEKPELAKSALAAVQWAHDLAVQVVLSGRPAVEISGRRQPQTTYHYVLPEGKHHLRIVKLASKHSALPGEEIEFTIRFDNLGDQTIGNVTILDNLSPRLEYVAQSARCTLEADFSVEENEAESLVLRWELVEPLEVGKGGVIHFRCRVR